MSRLNPVAKFSVIGVEMPEGGQGSCTDMDFGFWGGGVLGGTGDGFCWRILLELWLYCQDGSMYSSEHHSFVQEFGVW
jgi:hypothetical protein